MVVGFVLGRAGSCVVRRSSTPLALAFCQSLSLFLFSSLALSYARSLLISSPLFSLPPHFCSTPRATSHRWPALSGPSLLHRAPVCLCYLCLSLSPFLSPSRLSLSVCPQVVSVFSLSQELLSPQQHYDWGLRGLKAILVTGGKLIVASKASGQEINDVVEADLLVKALRVNTVRGGGGRGVGG